MTFTIERAGNRKGGGLATLVSKELSAWEQPIDLYTNSANMEIQNINIQYKQRLYNIVNIYIPPEGNREDQLSILGKLIKENTVIAGDINCRVKMFGDTITNKEGEILEQWVTRQGLHCFNKIMRKVTREQGGRNSVLDLIIATYNCENRFTLKRIEERGTSDHYPLWLQLKKQVTKKNKRIFTNWDRLSKKVNQRMETQEGDLDTEFWSTSIQKLKKEETNVVQYEPKKNPWFDKKCAISKLNRDKLEKESRSCPTITNIQKYREARAEYKRVLLKKKRDYWEKRIFEIDNIKDLYREVGKAKSIHNWGKSTAHLVIESNDTQTTDARRQADLLLNHFVKHNRDRKSVV